MIMYFLSAMFNIFTQRKLREQYWLAPYKEAYITKSKRLCSYKYIGSFISNVLGKIR